mmetsp:Transcript_6168/g.15075  ORF Transcript_6168/g.15075 Transcript_6168/m.15075 type:complete len:275 (+) Transcript_6168:328-1152(+)
MMTLLSLGSSLMSSSTAPAAISQAAPSEQQHAFGVARTEMHTQASPSWLLKSSQLLSFPSTAMSTWSSSSEPRLHPRSPKFGCTDTVWSRCACRSKGPTSPPSCAEQVAPSSADFPSDSSSWTQWSSVPSRPTCSCLSFACFFWRVRHIGQRRLLRGLYIHQDRTQSAWKACPHCVTLHSSPTSMSERQITHVSPPVMHLTTGKRVSTSSCVIFARRSLRAGCLLMQCKYTRRTNKTTKKDPDNNAKAAKTDLTSTPPTRIASWFESLYFTCPP